MADINVRQSIITIGEAIMESHDAFFSSRKKKQRIELKTNDNICYLVSGEISIYRLEDNLLTITLSAPAILGLAQMRNVVESHYIRCNIDCEMWVIHSDEAMKIFTEKKLWNHAFDILTKHLQLYFTRESTVSQKNVRGIVIEHLKEIWRMDEDKRMKTSIFSYILQRNHLSRSGVHKIISQLACEGVIDVSRGRLLSFRSTN